MLTRQRNVYEHQRIDEYVFIGSMARSSDNQLEREGDDLNDFVIIIFLYFDLYL